MFDGLTGKFGDIFDRLRRRAHLSEADVGAALREVRVALLEADVALPVVKRFMDTAKERAVGQEVLKNVNPGQQVIKVVHDCLVEMLGGDPENPTPPDLEGRTPLPLKGQPPVAVMMVGLQGSGKTTSTAKLAKQLTERDRKKVLMASLDVRRPAAQEQLRVLGEQARVATLDIVPLQGPVDIAKRAMKTAAREGYDVVLLDTAGRLAIDEELMQEVAAVSKAADPAETLLVADAMTGQDAVNVATAFDERLDLTGIVLTRVDGDARGGAALSMRAVTGKPIRLLGVGEKLDALEGFYPERVAQRILGMGDIVSLVEKAKATIDEAEAEKLAKKLQKGGFDLNDMASQLKQMRKMGGMKGLMAMMPGVGKMKKQLDAANIDEKMLIRQEAIISSMTKQERANPKLLHAKRKLRIAAGSGTSVQEINKLMKQFDQMNDVLKKMKKMQKKGGMPQLPPGMELPPELAGGMPGGAGGGMPGLGGGGGLPGLGAGGLPGLGGGGGLPGLGGGKRKK